jgi:hypothetical protein
MNEQQNKREIRQQDAEIYRARNLLNVTNSNMFVSNNNNPFLVSPYAPPTNVAKTSQINEINVIISSLIGALSTVINLSTFTLSISTITNIPGGNVVTISSQNVDVTGDNFNVFSEATFHNIVTFDDTASFVGSTFFNNISTGNIFASNGTFSTLTASSISIASEIIINSLQVNSTIYTSSIQSQNISTGDIFASNGVFSTLTASSISIADEIIIN